MEERQPVLAHANGVDGKEYFLRDRKLWYLNDFETRFEGQNFLTYEHPPRLQLFSIEYSVSFVVSRAMRSNYHCGCTDTLTTK